MTTVKQENAAMHNDNMQQADTLRGALEALLFVSDEPVTSSQLAKILNHDLVDVDEALRQLAESYADEDRGFQLREVAGGWRMYTHPAHAAVIEAYVLSWDTRKLSQAALEVLSVIAYKQPVNRAGINAVRGVNSESVVSSLIEKGLVRELGREAGAGNAILYGTTNTFLEKFGLRSIEDLPPLKDFAPDEQTQASIRRRLGVDEEARPGDFDDLSPEAIAEEAESIQSSTQLLAPADEQIDTPSEAADSAASDGDDLSDDDDLRIVD
ncbi:MAG: SMC-Scp complex subunit ScpB [Coriobacteriia bacterium]|nr:SMC-Scp complex subunit ScpB [Coriobacteriia bacterium]